MGDVTLDFNNSKYLILKDCYYIPIFKRNLISISCLIRQGYFVYFDSDVSVFKNRSPICIGFHTSNLFYLQPNILSLHNIENDDTQAKPSHKKAKVSTNDEKYLWHLRLGHINQNRIKRLVKDGPLSSLEVKPLSNCESCLESKMIKRPFTGKGQGVGSRMPRISTHRFCGPLNVQARVGFEYFITFTDDHSR